MSEPVSAVVIALSLAVAIGSVVIAIRDRRMGNVLFFALVALELLLVVQLVIGIVEVAGGRRPPSTVTFLAYGVGVLFIAPVATLWSLADKSRSSVLVITVATLAIPVMTVRMLQMWSSAHG